MIIRSVYFIGLEWTQAPMIEYNTALVTGASSGIGAAIARQLCLADVQVLAVGRSKDRLEKVRSSLPKKKQRLFLPVVGDLANKKDITQILKQGATYSPVDLLVNNAGTGYCDRFENIPDEAIENTVSTNLIGHILLTKGMLKQRLPDTPMHVVFVTSLFGKIGFENLSVYSATKFALEGLCEALRIEYENTSVDITVLRPGITNTNFFKVAGMEDFHNSVKGTKALHSPDSVAKALLVNADKRPNSIIVGNDKYFIPLIPFIPFKYRLKVLNIINKI